MGKRIRRSTDKHRAHKWQRRGGQLEAAAGLSGRPLSGSTIRRNGRLRFVGEFVDPLDPPPVIPPEASRLASLQRRLAKVRAQYRLSGSYSDEELLIMDLAFDHVSLEKIGARIGMTRQGVEYHVQRLMTRALEFKNFWRYKNRMRRRK